jgi:hypothetical protein
VAASTAAGIVAPRGPFPGGDSVPANNAGVAECGALPWPLITPPGALARVDDVGASPPSPKCEISVTARIAATPASSRCLLGNHSSTGFRGVAPSGGPTARRPRNSNRCACMEAQTDRAVVVAIVSARGNSGCSRSVKSPRGIMPSIGKPRPVNGNPSRARSSVWQLAWISSLNCSAGLWFAGTAVAPRSPTIRSQRRRCRVAHDVGAARVCRRR